MKKSQPLPLMACLLMIFGWVGYVHGQDAGKTPELQEMDQVIEMMKQQGLDSDQIQQMQEILKSVGQVGGNNDLLRRTGNNRNSKRPLLAMVLHGSRWGQDATSSR